MYKFTSIGLLVAVLVLGLFLTIEKCSHQKTKEELSNSQAKLEGVLQETETAKSRAAILQQDLKSQNDLLQKIIDERDEQILAQTQLNLSLKEKLFKITNAKQSVVTKEGKTVVVTEQNQCDLSLRYRVDFQAKDSPVVVSGYTLTNPAYAEVKIDWSKDFKLELNLTKDDDGNFRVYADSKDFKIKNINLSVDPEILEPRWYQRFNIGSDLYAGEFGAGFLLRPGYEIFDGFSLNALVLLQYDGVSAKLFYGGGVSWYPWK